ncbi:MAG: hypothetical protein MUP33_10470 [Polaromonas sp.]|nr:hypothetical protein [Polaromonas sp.]
MVTVTMTKADALDIQARLAAIYAPLCVNLADKVAAITTSDSLTDDVAYDTEISHEHIPRGRAIEQICCTGFTGDLLAVRLLLNKWHL